MGAAVLLGSFVLLLVLRVPIAFSLGISSALAAAVVGLPLEVVAQKMAKGLDAFSLMAIPFFILAGQIMADGGMARRLVNLASVFVGAVRGGLAMIDCLACMMFGAVSGSSVAATSSIGSILIPLMREEGYDRDYSVAITCAASTQGLLIPPSHNAIIYAAAAGGGISIGRLFLGGIVPGVLVGVALMMASYLIAVRRGYPARERVPLRKALPVVGEGLPALLVGLIIIGGIVSGIFTAVEASAIAVVYSFVIVFLAQRAPAVSAALAVLGAAGVAGGLLAGAGWAVQVGVVLLVASVVFLAERTLPLRALPGLLLRSVYTISIVMLLVAASKAFGYMLAYLRVPNAVAQALLSVSHSPAVVILLINLLLLLVGMMMDMAPAILILTPILLPVVTGLGFDPVHFGIILMLNLGIGLCTPPVGATLFVGCAVGQAKIEEVVRPLLLLYPAMIAVLLLVTYLPRLTLAIPDWLMPL